MAVLVTNAKVDAALPTLRILLPHRDHVTLTAFRAAIADYELPVL